jgi:hypothetical protein
MTPRPGNDDKSIEMGGLSMNENPKNLKLGKYQIFSESALKAIGFTFVHDGYLPNRMEGHVSIKPSSLELLREWAATRPKLKEGTGPAHYLSIAVKSTWRGIGRNP